MNVGDLVTLSAKGVNLQIAWRYYEDWRKGNIIGLVMEINKSSPYGLGPTYRVKWINDHGPRAHEEANTTMVSLMQVTAPSIAAT